MGFSDPASSLKRIFKTLTASRFIQIVAITSGLIAAIGFLRLANLNSFVTVDETLWLTRSGNFYYALTHHDFEETFQKSHPGVTTM